jgi:hypothetical protein
MWSWLTSPPVLLIGLVASVIGIAQPLARKVILFPHRRQEQQLGHALAPVIQTIATGKRILPPEGEDWSQYKA